MLQAAKAPIVLVTGAAGGLMGATGRVLTHLLLDRGVQVRALVRSEDDRAASLRAAGAEVLSSMIFHDSSLVDLCEALVKRQRCQIVRLT